MRVLYTTGKPFGGESRLDSLVQSFISSYFKTEVSLRLSKKWILDGRVYLDKSVCKVCSKVVFKKTKVAVFIPTEWGGENWLGSLEPIDIIYQDEHIIAINKPPGLASQATPQRWEVSAYERLIGALRDNNPRDLPYLGLLHRLDKGTSGVMMFSKKKSANKPIADQFTEHSLQKTYQAVVSYSPDNPHIDRQWTISNLLIRKKTSANGYKTLSCVTGGQSAISECEWTKTLTDESALITVLPKTGRTHQIRCHLSEANLPIHGDAIYGSKVRGRLKLHAKKLEIIHPATRKTIAFEAPLPDDFLKS